MHYFRYRPYSEFSLKELLYGEMYFSSPEECNDPFDSKAYCSFNANHEKWSKLIFLASEQVNLRLSEKDLNKLSHFLCEQCPLSFDEAISKNLLSHCTDEIFNGKLMREYLYQKISEIIELYRPSKRYFISFSKTNDETLMWSHYANQHNGFCLIFKAIDGKLSQSPIFENNQIRRPVSNGLSKEMSYNIPNSFKFVDIEYKSQVEALDAFLYMPAAVSGNVESESERAVIRKKQELHYQQKGDEWHYEKESRLILPPPPAWLFREHIELTKQERLFHYEPSQLVGIIYGAKLRNEDKNRIREVLSHRKKWLDRTMDYKRIRFNFIEFEASMSIHKRGLEVMPISILGAKKTFSNDDGFNRLYSEWKEGVGWERSDKGARKVIVK